MLLPGRQKKTAVLLTFVGAFRGAKRRILDHDKLVADQTACFGLDHLALPQEGQVVPLMRRMVAAVAHRRVEVGRQAVLCRRDLLLGQTVSE
jgi:hypothetical protein